MQPYKFNSIVDSAWGSSAKGAASTRLTDIYKIKHISTANYPNAGHTAIVNGNKFIAKALPTAAILHKEKSMDINLWIGPNSGFAIDQLKKEKEQTGYNNRQDLIHIHERAMIVEQRHIDMESPAGSQSTEHVSSTMSGSGAAYTEKAMRKKEVRLARDVFEYMDPMQFVKEMRTAVSTRGVLHEVSQGFALSVNHGTHYPFCTFRDCTPQQAYADLGILPNMVGDVYLNVRSFPIRVGNNYRDGKQTGYSGDCLSDQCELNWEQIGKDADMPQSEIDILAEKERTTVTKKIRRVFSFSWQLLAESASFCGATKQILNFPQYIHWSSHKVKGGPKEFLSLHSNIRKFVDKMEETTNVRVVMIGTGPEHDDYIYLD